MSKTPTAFLSDHSIRNLIAKGHVKSLSGAALEPEPSSIDLRPIGPQSILPLAFLPRATETVSNLVTKYRTSLAAPESPIMANSPTISIVQLDIELALPANVKALFSPKSSTGRLDVRIRVMADGIARYDETPYGYHGPIYAEITTGSFNVKTANASTKLTPGAALTQIRFISGTALDDSLTRREVLTLGLENGFAGYMADNQNPTTIIDMMAPGPLKTECYWRTIPVIDNDGIVLTNSGFFIMASEEIIKVKEDECAVVRAVETSIGLLISHRAGFIDPEFQGRLVYEVSNIGPTVLLRAHQPIAIVDYYRLDQKPSQGYGAGRISYQGQGVKLARCFV